MFLNVCCFSQKWECCKSKEEVDTNLNGYWVLKGDNSNEVFNYSYSHNHGVLSTLEKKDIKLGRIPIKTCQPFFKVIKNIWGYKIRYISMGGIVESKIKYLDPQKMVLETDGILGEYLKYNE